MTREPCQAMRSQKRRTMRRRERLALERTSQPTLHDTSGAVVSTPRFKSEPAKSFGPRRALEACANRAARAHERRNCALPQRGPLFRRRAAARGLGRNEADELRQGVPGGRPA
eukprot:759142-Pyramimonas_sp.AAC.1